MGSPVSNGDDFGGNETPPDDFGGDSSSNETPSSEKPFDDEPFDAGVEANEADSPEKFIQQLSGKLGQSLRKYTEEAGQPDFDLEKYAINSVLSATNSGEMDQDDQTDIIQKVKSSSTDGDLNHDHHGHNNDDEEHAGEEHAGEDASEEGGLDLSGVDMEESHNPNINGKTVFKDATLGVNNGGMEENKYLNLENTNKSSILVDKIRKMVKESLTTIEPQVEPQVKPQVIPERITRRNKPYRIIPEQLPDPKPKAEKKNDDVKFIKDSKFSQDGNSVTIQFDVNGERFQSNFINTGELLHKPQAYDESWIYAFESEILPNGKTYSVAVAYFGHPDTNLDLEGYADGKIPDIEEI